MIRKTIAHTQAATFELIAPRGPGGAATPVGTAFCVSPDGHFLTAAHCLTGLPDAAPLWMRRVSKVVDAGRRIPVVVDGVRIVARDLDADVALLQAEGTFLHLESEPAPIELGTPIYVFGYPGFTQEPMPRLCSAIVSALAPTSSMDASLCSMDVALEPGMSGAPVIAVETGRVIGVVRGAPLFTYSKTDSTSGELMHIHIQHGLFMPLGSVRLPDISALR